MALAAEGLVAPTLLQTQEMPEVLELVEMVVVQVIVVPQMLAQVALALLVPQVQHTGLLIFQQSFWGLEVVEAPEGVAEAVLQELMVLLAEQVVTVEQVGQAEESYMLKPQPCLIAERFGRMEQEDPLGQMAVWGVLAKSARKPAEVVVLVVPVEAAVPVDQCISQLRQ